MKKNGFTLIEILIAVGIFATVSLVLLSGFTTASQVNSDDERLLQVVLLAGNKMAELENEIQEDIARGKFPDEVTKSEKFEQPFQDYQWEYTIKKVEIPVVEGGEGNSAVVESTIKNIMKTISNSVRELKLTVTWTDPEDAESNKTTELTTHLVNIK